MKRQPRSQPPRAVLYVDDNPEDRRLMDKAVKKAGQPFQLRTASTYYGVIDYLRGHDEYADRTSYPSPSLLLIDYSLGSFKGTDLVKWIRSEDEFSALPLVMLSGSTESQHVAECYAAGADFYIVKEQPFSAWLKLACCVCAFLQTDPPSLDALRPLAINPELSSHRLKLKFNAAAEKNRALREQSRQQLTAMDAALAEGKEVRKQFPFQRARGPK